MYDNSSKVIEIDINEILPNRFQPRIQFDEEEILELSDSIKEHGVIQPIVVRTIGDKYEIIAGERRYKASVLAGKETVPVIVKNLNDKDSAEIALIENIQRKNLTPIEEALSYKKILDMGYLTQEGLAIKLGKSQSAVANKIRLLNLSDEVQEALLENKISERHARSLLKLSTSKLQNEMLNRIVSERLTVRKADEEIEKLNNNTSDESNSDEQKIKEKGEINMNNNMFGIPNIPQNQQTSPSTFGMINNTNQQSAINPVQELVQSPSNFDIFENTTPNQIPQTETVKAEENSMTNTFIAPQPTTSTESLPSIVLNQPKEGEIQFDALNPIVMSQAVDNTKANPVVNSFIESQPMTSTELLSSIEPQTTPIMESSMAETNVGMAQSSVVSQQSAINPVQEVVQSPSNFDIFENSTPMQNQQIETVKPKANPAVNAFIESQPMVAIDQEPSIVPNMPRIGELQFDETGTIVQEQDVNKDEKNSVVNSIPEVQPIIPSTESLPPMVPQTAPIMESAVARTNSEMTQQSENLFSFGHNDLNTTEVPTSESTSIPEFKMPEPIIVTDYSKQYDPVMPQTLANVPTHVDFKEVINAIRECSKKIEQYGFKIDVEEYDLENMYQVVYKIEK